MHFHAAPCCAAPAVVWTYLVCDPCVCCMHGIMTLTVMVRNCIARTAGLILRVVGVTEHAAYTCRSAHLAPRIDFFNFVYFECFIRMRLS